MKNGIGFVVEIATNEMERQVCRGVISQETRQTLSVFPDLDGDTVDSEIIRDEGNAFPQKVVERVPAGYPYGR